MTRKLQPVCHINPKTGNPFTRHNYRQQDLRVTSYYKGIVGEDKPGSYTFNLVCKRCGFSQRVDY